MTLRWRTSAWAVRAQACPRRPRNSYPAPAPTTVPLTRRREHLQGSRKPRTPGRHPPPSRTRELSSCAVCTLERACL
jgi:hypothetical protein